MNFTCLFFGFLFAFQGMLIWRGKGHMCLSVWKNMSPSERRQIKIVPLCRNLGGLILINAGIFLLKGFWPAFSNRCFVWTMIAWMIAAGIDAWLISTSKRYVRNNRSQHTLGEK